MTGSVSAPAAQLSARPRRAKEWSRNATAARRVRLLGLDVDGVLTDNGVFIGPIGGERVELKRFDIQDDVFRRAAVDAIPAGRVVSVEREL